MTDLTLEDQFEKLGVHHYDSQNGPVWCVRLIQKEHTDSCPVDEVHKDFLHQYHIFFGFHHAITDGYSNIRICQHFLTLLNQVIGQESINDEIQLAEYFGNELSDYILNKVKEDTIKNDNMNDILNHYQNLFDHATYFSKIQPQPEVSNLRTMNYQRALDVDKTIKLLKTAKENKVSMHSCLTAICDIALIELLTRHGVNEDEYKFLFNHVINKRIYWKTDASRRFGPHFGQLILMNTIKKETESNFWQYVKDIHKEFQEAISNLRPFQFELVRENIMSKPTPIQKPPYFDEGINNMGNLTGILEEGGNHVQICSLHRTTSIHAINGNNAHVFQTFRGRLFYGYDFVNRIQTPKIAEEYVNIIFKKMENVTQ